MFKKCGKIIFSENIFLLWIVLIKFSMNKYHKHSIKHLHTHSPYKAANNTRRGYVVQKGSTKSRTALNTKATLLIINASTLVTSAITPDKIRPTVLVIPENEIKI